MARPKKQVPDAPVQEIPAKWHPSQVPDDDPKNPRPPFDLERGWQTPEVVSWAKAKAFPKAKPVTEAENGPESDNTESHPDESGDA